MRSKKTGFGTFINSFVNPVNGQVEVELLEDRMIVQLGLDRLSQNFVLETAQAIFDPLEPLPKAEQLLIFEMAGEFQLVTIAPSGTAFSASRQSFSKFKIVHRLDNFNDLRNEFPFANRSTMWRKVSGFNQLRGCSIQGNSSVGFNMTIIEIMFEEPVLIFNSTLILSKSALKQSPRRLEEDSIFGGLTPGYQLCSQSNNRILQVPAVPMQAQQSINITKRIGEISETLKSYSIKIIRQSDYSMYLKWKIAVGDSVTVDLMGMSSDQYTPLERVIKGNFITVHSFETSLNRKELVGNKINPLLNYRTIWFTKGENKLASEIGSVDGFFAIMSIHKFRTAFQFITYRNSDQQVAIYRTNGKELLLQKVETTKFKANYFELYNSTTAIIQGEYGLYVFDSVVV